MSKDLATEELLLMLLKVSEVFLKGEPWSRPEPPNIA
jgi:hypothetical protein